MGTNLIPCRFQRFRLGVGHRLDEPEKIGQLADRRCRPDALRLQLLGLLRGR